MIVYTITGNSYSPDRISFNYDENIIYLYYNDGSIIKLPFNTIRTIISTQWLKED